jgi:CRISPR-associated protein Csd1
VALDPENTDPAYLLGRLFAVLERFQTLALGKVNATIRDRYFGSASATPRTVFPILIRMYQHHRSKAEKGDKPRLAGYFTGQLSEIMNLLPPELPATLPLKAQGKFALGYFHQMNRRRDAEIAPEELTEKEKAA